jgi:hypothetical protein
VGPQTRTRALGQWRITYHWVVRVVLPLKAVFDLQFDPSGPTAVPRPAHYTPYAYPGTGKNALPMTVGIVTNQYTRRRHPWKLHL